MSNFFRKNSLVSVTAAIFLVLLFSLFLDFGFAQVNVSSQSLEISPPSQELQADPGQSVLVKAKVRNRTQDRLPIQVRIEDFTAQGEEGQIALIEKGPYSLTSWAALDRSSFELAAGATREVLATITVPKDAAGGRYGSFVFSIGGQAVPGTAGVSQEIASLFLVKISGPVNERLSVVEFSAPSFVEFGPVPFTLKFNNAGNVHVKPFGLVNVRNVFGGTVQDVVVAGQANIFPGASRAVSVSLDKKWLIGPFTAEAVLNYGSKNESLQAQTTFFAFPVRVAAAGLLLGVVLYLTRKRIRLALKALMGK